MVQFLYFVALGLAVWGVAILASGEFVAMLDIATSLFASAAVVAGLAAVAGGLNRIVRVLHRFSEMTPEPAMPEAAERHFAEERPFAAEPDASRQAPPPWHGDSHAGVGWGEEPAPSESLLEPAIGDMPLPPEPAIASVPAPEPEPEPDSERVIRSGTLDGVLYRFFADGSVEAVGDHGQRRFASIEELKDEILAARREAGAGASAPPPEAEPARAEAEAPAVSAEALAAEPARPEPSRFDRRAARAERRAARLSSEAAPRAAAAAPAPAAAEPPAEASPLEASLPEASLLEEASPAEPPPVTEAPPPSKVRMPAAAPAVEPPSTIEPSKPPAAEAQALPPAEVEPAPTPPAVTDAPAPAVPRPESRLERFEEDIWAATLAELRRPFENAVAGKSEASGRAKTDEPPSRP